MRFAAQAILDIALVYLVLGAVCAVGFVTLGIGRVLPRAGPVSLGARIMILPGAVVLWPLLLRRWLVVR